MNLIDLDLCNSTQWYNGRIRSTNVCAGYPEGKIDTCQVTFPRAPCALPTPLCESRSSPPPGPCFSDPFPGPLLSQ